MTRPIVDSSVATAWCSTSQATPLSEAALEAATRFGMLVPAHFQLEVANALRQLERRNRIATAEVDAFLAALTQLSVEVDAAAQAQTFALIVPIARRFDLTTYDAAYLELALRTGLSLATRDAALAAAARQAGAILLNA